MPLFPPELPCALDTALAWAWAWEAISADRVSEASEVRETCWTASGCGRATTASGSSTAWAEAFHAGVFVTARWAVTLYVA